MNKLLLHKKTEQQASTITVRPPHAILVVGPAGSGKLSIAKLLIAKLLNVSMAKLSDYPYFFHLQKPVKLKEIPIDAVRELIKTLKLTTPGKREIKRVVIIEDAEALSHAAQNSLLKLLEEPPADTVLILTAQQAGSLLPTIVSRAQVLEVHAPTLKQALTYFNGSHSPADISSAWHMSQGSAALMSSLLGDAKHSLRQSVEQFKQFLKMDQYARLQTLEQLSKDREDFIAFLDAGRRVLGALQADANARSNPRLSSRIVKARKLLYESRRQLDASASARLVELNIALSLTV